MKIEFEGSLSDIRSEMEDFLAGSGGETGGKASTSKTTASKNTKAKVEKVTADTIREAMLACDNKDGKKALLADYGALKISELDEDKFEDFLAELKKL